MESAGFQVQYAVLFDRFTELKGSEGLKDWSHMFIKIPFQVLPDHDAQEMIIGMAVENLKAPFFERENGMRIMYV